tara:strand:- start:31 stop:621 length:591 start_codon:yes stop_codon:yes gene_type:complete
MKINTIGYLLIILILVISVKTYFESDYFNLKCIISNVDGRKYCVREREKMGKASNLLAKTTKNMTNLVNYLKKKYPNRNNVKRLVKNYNPRTIKETLPTSEYTAYSENKGEKIAFCLNTKKNNNTLIDLNTLTYVALHEMGHVASETIGHNDEFWNNFKFLLEEAVLINIYKPVDYKNESVTYCGMELTDNPYYDM